MKDLITEELVSRAREGDKLALVDLLSRSDDLIRGTIRTFHLSSEAEDLLQDIRIKIIEKLPELENPQAYPKWLMTMAHNHCLNFLDKKRPSLVEKREGEDGKEDEQTGILETQGLAVTSQGEFQKYEASLELKERIEKTIKVMGLEAFGLLEKAHVQELSLKDLVALSVLKKSALSDKIKIEGARWILLEANEDWNVSDYEAAKGKLAKIVAAFRPGDDYTEKRFLLASALSRLGDINQVQGQIRGPNKSIDHYRRARKIWRSLRDEKMASYAIHMIALDNNIMKNYPGALKYLDEAREEFKAKDAHTRRWLGDLERDTASVYLNMGEIELSQRHLEKALAMLEMADHRESYFAALRVKGNIEIKRRHFDAAYDALEDSVRESPRYRALHHLQTKVAKVNLFLAANETNEALICASEAEAHCKQFCLRHQLSRLREVLLQYPDKINPAFPHLRITSR